MMGFRKPAAQSVSEMLEAQHRALLAGDLDVLGRMAPELERVFLRLGREGGPRKEVIQIKEAATRNARLLLAAQAGIATARASLDSSRATELTTYGADGQSQAGAPVASRTIVRR